MLSKSVIGIKETPIMEIANFGRAYSKETGKEVLAAWFGEGNKPTKNIIYNETIKSLNNGNTFYTYQNGLPKIREALSNYMNNVFDLDTIPENHSLVTGGMLGIKIICDMLIEKGDEVVIVGPVWPNIRSSVILKEGKIKEVNIKLTDKWDLDFKELFSAVSDKTKMVFINSPSNPTGWMLTEEEQEKIISFLRKKNCWLISDEVYHQIVYDRDNSSSFLKFSRPDDKLIVINSSSKSFNMTGWRIGWLSHPENLGSHIAKLVQISTTGVPEFLQEGFYSALINYKSIVSEIKNDLKKSRDFLFKRTKNWSKIQMPYTNAAFYSFFKVKGMKDSIKFAKYLIEKTQVGLAPGVAFGKSGEGHLRLCFASDLKYLENILSRLEKELA